MAFKSMGQMVEEACLVVHEKCKECEFEETCYAGGRGVYLCTRWDEDWHRGKPTNVTVEANSSSQTVKQDVKPKPKLAAEPKDQRKLF